MKNVQRGSIDLISESSCEHVPIIMQIYLEKQFNKVLHQIHAVQLERYNTH